MKPAVPKPAARVEVAMPTDIDISSSLASKRDESREMVAFDNDEPDNWRAEQNDGSVERNTWEKDSRKVDLTWNQPQVSDSLFLRSTLVFVWFVRLPQAWPDNLK